MKQKNIVSFVQIAENKTSKCAVLSRITINLTTCTKNRKPQPTMYDMTVWENGYQEQMLLNVDPQEKYAYIFADSFILSYDLLTNQVDQINQTNPTVCDDNYGSFIPHAFDLKDEWAVVAGTLLIQNTIRSKPCLYIFGLRPLRIVNTSTIGINPIYGMERITHNLYHSVSVSINPAGTAVAIGEPRLSKVIIAFMGGNKTSRFVSKFAEIGDATSWVGFGRSVAWLNNEETLAILVGKSDKHNLIESEIHIYKNIFSNARGSSTMPSFTIPNSQQTLYGIDRWLPWLKHSFVRIFTRSNSLLILLSDAKIVYIPSANIGFCSMELMPISFPTAYILQPRPCVSGSYKNTSGPGPCTICPPGTKNPGNFPSIECQPCNSTSFCPLGASDDVNIYNFQSYDQTLNYPDSPAIDNYDDLLVFNFFPNSMTARCFVSTPFFWALLTTIFCLIIWFSMFIIKRRQLTRADIYRQRAKKAFKHTDLIGEGERWIGGLASIIIFTLIIYSGVFASFYLHSYPLETAGAIDEACHNSQRNTKFDNALQLPLPEIDGTYWKIFDMLNKQPFTMTIDLINTRVHCDNITVKRNRHTGTSLSTVEKNCSFLPHSVSGLFSFALPAHTSVVQVSIGGPHFIGAVRLCLHGHEDKLDADFEVHTLHELDVCTLFYTDNQTIGVSTDFTVRLIKVINVTKPLQRNDKTFYDGRWAPMIMYTDILSDELYFAEDGEYLRYTSEQTTFNIQFNEIIYFVQNNQSPIIRRGALFFHTLLFGFSILEIFSIIFLLYKLWCQPLLRRLVMSRDDLLKHDLQLTESLSQLPQSSESQTQLPANNANGHLSAINEYTVTSSSDCSILQQLPEYFDRMERLSSEFVTMKNKIDELVRENNDLKQRLVAIRKEQQE